MARPRVGSLVVLALVLAVLAGGLWLFIPRGPADPEQFLGRRGGPVSVAVLDSTTTGARRVWDLEITSSTGLRVRGRVSFPRNDGGPWPLLLLQGGLRTGSRALDHVPDPGPLVLASLDYPYRMPPRAGFLRVLRELPRMRSAAADGVAGLWLFLEYLELLPEVDPERTVIAGGSLGAPFAAVAGALEPRFEGVALLYGGADLARVVGAHLPYRSGLVRGICVRLLRPWLDPVDPARFVPGISPRPLLLVNGRGDEEIPRECALALHAAAREPKTVVWVDTPHRVQGNAELTEPVAQAVWEWMRTSGWRDPPSPGNP